MNEDERIKKLMRAGLHDPKNDYKLFIKETNWRAKPKYSKTYSDVVDKLKEQDPTQCEFFRSPWKYNESSIKITNDKEYIQLLEGMVEELRDQVNYKDEEWYWYWIPERLKYK